MEVIKKELLAQLIEAAEYAAFYLEEFDEPHVHAMAVLDGFTVLDGKCNNPECVLCNLKRVVEDAGKALRGAHHKWATPIKGTQTPLFEELPPAKPSKVVSYDTANKLQYPDKQDLSWLDRFIEEQKGNTDLIKRVCAPFSPADVAALPEDEEPFFRAEGGYYGCTT